MAAHNDRQQVHDGLEAVAGAIRGAWEHGQLGSIGAVLHRNVVWGDCADRSDVLALVESIDASGEQATLFDVEVAEDRLIIRVSAGELAEPITLALFICNGQISQIIDASGREHALNVRPLGSLGEAADRGWTGASAVPVLPVRDLSLTVTNYRQLGFDVRAYEGEAAYAFATAGGIDLHFTQVQDLEPTANMSAVYLYVDDADALFAAWRLASAPGRLSAPRATEYGLREGSYVDPDGNLLRFGSPIST